MPSLLSSPRRQTAAALLASVAAVPLLGFSAFHSQLAPQPRPANSDAPAERKYRDRIHTAWLPPGRYHSIIIATNAETRRWIVALRTTRATFPITVAPAENTVITFPEPWTVTVNDQARLESIDVPWGDISRDSPLAEGNLLLSAWGVTDTGPVNFVVRPARP